MSSPALSPCDIPEIIEAVLIQVAKLRAEGALSQRRFTAQINRLVAEELLPRGLTVAVTGLEGGGTRFLVKGKGGQVFSTIDCPGGNPGTRP